MALFRELQMLLCFICPSAIRFLYLNKLGINAEQIVPRFHGCQGSNPCSPIAWNKSCWR